MRAIRLHQAGGPEALRYEDAPKPNPKDNEVLVRVYATAITPTEFAWYPTFHTPDGATRPFPIILGHEFSGAVDAIGSACTGVQIGDPVYGLSDWFINGAQADYCLTVPANIAPKPATLDHTRTAVIPISALTAWQALIDRAQLREGQRVLVHGAAGGVGSFAVQIARHKKAHVIATASAANADCVTALGANEVIDYRTTPFETVVRDVDVVLDTVGGDTRDRSWEVLSKGGRLVTIAADAERLTQPRVRDAFFIVEPNRVQLIEIARLIDAGVIRPIVGTVFAMESFRQAYDQKPMCGKHVLCTAESRCTQRNTRERSTRMMTASAIHTMVKQALKWTALAGVTLVMGQATALAEDSVSIRMKQPLADIAGKVATVLTVEYAPGAASDPHVHPGSVFAYVLEGTVVTQLEGEQPMTYTKGQSWYESPKKPHVVSRNASVTEPAKLLVFLLSQEGEALKVPVKALDSGK